MEYAKLTIPQKWEWHAEVYAFRRVVLGVSRDERTSPVDVDGKWFDEQLANAAERRMRQKYEQIARQCADDTKTRNAVRFADAEQWRRSQEGRRFLEGLHQSAGREIHTAADLGVTAREYSPTPEQMRASRIALGLEDE